MIRLYDTMAREKRDFTPADPDRITMYVCGPTVYGHAHIGNARPAVVFDTLARLIRHVHPDHELSYARNITDIDDKIIDAATAEGVTIREISTRYEEFYLRDMGALGVLPPDFAPHATAFVPRMIDMISRLIDDGYAYEANGHVLFEVAKDREYGSLSRRDGNSMRAGARVEVATYKRADGDFVLWKPSALDVVGWDAPWGRGRPGWHIECSAMIENWFGDVKGVDTIDIHGGGQDLIFPHHENELAQSRCAHAGAPLARYWVHNGFVDMGAEKMSKSLGNVVTVEDLLAQGHKGETLRLALLSTHYRSPLPWTEAAIIQSQRTLDGFYRKVGETNPGSPAETVLAALSDDLNVPKALAALHQINDPSTLKASANLLGLLGGTRELWERPVLTEAVGMASGMGEANARSQAIPEVLLNSNVHVAASFSATVIRGEPFILGKLAERATAKARRDFAESDRIRDELKADGIILEDGPGGTSWRRA